MTPIRETIARAIYTSFAGGTSDETLDDMATAIAQSAADSVLRALDEAGMVVVPREPSEAMIEAHFEAHAQAAAFFADVPDVWRAMISAAVVE